LGEPGAPRGGTVHVSVWALGSNVRPCWARSVAFVVTLAWSSRPERSMTTVPPPGNASGLVAFKV